MLQSAALGGEGLGSVATSLKPLGQGQSPGRLRSGDQGKQGV